jgi:hypothetical protein
VKLALYSRNIGQEFRFEHEILSVLHIFELYPEGKHGMSKTFTHISLVKKKIIHIPNSKIVFQIPELRDRRWDTPKLNENQNNFQLIR